MQDLINQKDHMYYVLIHQSKFNMHVLFIWIFYVRINHLGCGLGGILLINDGMLSLFSRYLQIMLFTVIRINLQMMMGHAYGHGDDHDHDRGHGDDHGHGHDDDDDHDDHEFI